MKRLMCVAVLASVLCGSIAHAAEAALEKPRRFSGATVLAKYVAGSDKEGDLGKLGCIETSNVSSGAPSLFFLPYLYKQGGLRRAGGFVTHLVDPSLIKGGRLCNLSNSSSDFPIAYDDIKVLARGQVKNMGQESTGALQSVGAIGGVVGLGTILSSSTLSNSVKISAGGAVGFIGLIAGGAYLNRRTNNYIVIFYDERKGKKEDPKLKIQSRVTTQKFTQVPNSTGEMKTTSQVTTTQTTEAAPATEETSFCKCKVAVFQIIDPHDYWNLSMFLSAATGRSFVDEAVLKSGSAPASAKK